MRDYRKSQAHRERENAFKKRGRERHRNSARVVRRNAERKHWARVFKTLREKRYYKRCKEQGWRRVRVHSPCFTCNALTRWRVRRCYLITDPVIKAGRKIGYGYEFRWVSGCRGC